MHREEFVGWFKKILFVLVISWLSFPVFAENHDREKYSSQQILTMDFKNIPVRELLQFIAESLHLNIVMSETVAGNITLHFQNICWKEALDTVLEMTGLAKKQRNNILLISTPAEFAAKQKALLEAAPVHSFRVKFKHADINLVQQVLKSQTDLFSPFAKIAINPRDNSLWIKENLENVSVLSQYLKQLDKPEPQLLITAKILNIDDKKIHELGISFNQVAIQDPISKLNISVPPRASNRLSIAIASIAQSQLLNLQIDALESAGHSKIIANPQVITQSRKTATIEAGEEIPYQESTSSGATSITFKKAALSLKVTPTQLPDGRITMELEINQNKTSSLEVNGTPAIQTQILKTEVVVGNGQTVVLGGIFEKSTMEIKNKIPGVSSLPLLGGLFSQSEKHCVRKELLILVTPQILAGT
jgi:type IV pilus assembly protein PilQ